MPSPLSSPEEADDFSARVTDLLRPLDSCDADAEPRRSIHEVRGDEIPEPHRELLVHGEGMTSRLAAQREQAIDLRPLATRRAGDVLTRHVLLVASRIDRAVLFGAIRIHLDRFDDAPREAILASKIPLGTILDTHRVAHRRRLMGFFRIGAGDLSAAFGSHGSEPTYGRHSLLLSPSGELMAEVVEVLPPDAGGVSSV